MKKVILGLLLWSPLVLAQNQADYLQTKLNGIRTLSAAFKQTVQAKKRTLSQSSGNMALARPGHFRWQTKNPMAQLVVADGKQIWVYDVELEQVSVKKQGQNLGGAAALFLSGYNDMVTRDFNVTLIQKDNLDYFDLKAKSNKANFERIKLVFAGDLLNAIELYDQLGQHTRVSLSDVKMNPKLAANVFQFKVPKGVDVVRQ